MIAASPSAIFTAVAENPACSLAPPVIAIVLAIVIKEVNFSLLLAIFSGCLLLSDFNATASVECLCHVLVQQVADADHASVIIFTVLLGAMIGLMNDSGGTGAVVASIAKFADTRKKGQVLTWVAGLLVFFDDYANTMLVGSSVRPLTDRLQISRAKLAFLIDATAAPVAGLALSTWTAFEIQQVQLGLSEAELTANATSVFLSTLPYRIYPIIAIVCVGAIAFSGKDFGPMLKAEQQKSDEQVGKNRAAHPAKAGSIWTAVIPICVLIATVFGLLAGYRLTGVADWWQEVDAYKLLLVTSLAASTAAALANIVFRRMTLAECSESWVRGITSMIPAVIVLILAWGISGVCSRDQLNTAGYIISLIGNSIQPQFLPAIAFIAAGAVAVSIGSSFTTMGLLVPMFIPLSVAVIDSSGEPGIAENPIFLAMVGAILAGAIFGDHCSPISDTTVLSSAAAGCNHLQHVATQVPYAVLMAVASLLLGYLPIGFGAPWWICLPLSTAVCIGTLLVFGKSPADNNQGS